MNKTRAARFGTHDPISLNLAIPQDVDMGIWKCRVVYGTHIEKVTFEPYHPRTIKSYKLINAPSNLDYSHKGDRTELKALYDERGDHDDILIVKNGYLTDTYWANILLLSENRWYTPSTPLLKGTMRQYLLDSGMVMERIVTPEDLRHYEKIMSVNAMNPFDVENALSIDAVH